MGKQIAKEKDREARAKRAKSRLLAQLIPCVSLLRRPAQLLSRRILPAPNPKKNVPRKASTIVQNAAKRRKTKESILKRKVLTRSIDRKENVQKKRKTKVS